MFKKISHFVIPFLALTQFAAAAQAESTGLKKMLQALSSPLSTNNSKCKISVKEMTLPFGKIDKVKQEIPALEVSLTIPDRQNAMKLILVGEPEITYHRYSLSPNEQVLAIRYEGKTLDQSFSPVKMSVEQNEMGEITAVGLTTKASYLNGQGPQFTTSYPCL